MRPEQALQAYRWSSYPSYLDEASRRPQWLRVDRLLGEWGIPKDSPAGRAEFAGHIRKVRIAARLRQETTMTLAWIAQRLHMGAPGHVSCLPIGRSGWGVAVRVSCSARTSGGHSPPLTLVVRRAAVLAVRQGLLLRAPGSTILGLWD